MFLETYINRPGKSLSSIIFIIIGISTILYFQDIQVENLKILLSNITEESTRKTLLLSWGFNLFSAVGFIAIGYSWLNEVFVWSETFYDSIDSKIICAVTGLVFLIGSWFFISFIFTKLIGVVIASLIAVLFIYGNTSNRQ